MKPANSHILTINGGSSSIRFALFEAGEMARLRLSGKIDRIGARGTNLTVTAGGGKNAVPQRLTAADHRKAVGYLLGWLESQAVFASIEAVGHRVVHGMKHSEPERITPQLLEDLRRFFVPQFKFVRVWETIYPTRHNLYFVASQSPIELFS